MELIIAVMRGIQYGNVQITAHDASLPIGWYNVIDEEGNDEKVIVFASQEEGYLAMKADAETLKLTEEFDGAELAKTYFKGFGLTPDPDDLVDVAGFVHDMGSFPELQTFAQRDEIDPGMLAAKFNEELLPMVTTKERISEIYSSHRTIIDSLYGNRDYYERRIVDFMMYPKGIVPIGTRVEEVEREFYQLDPAPFEDSLEDILSEVLKEQASVLGENYRRPTIAWTDKPYKSYFAQYDWAIDHIKVNDVLNSRSVPRETMKFLIYHECLHQLIHKHGTEFRRLERLFPDFTEHEHFLDYKFPDFYREKAM